METKRSSTFNWVLIAALAVLYVLSLAGLLYGNYMAGDSAAWQLIVSGILLSIPLILLYFSIYVLATAASQRHLQGQIDRRLARLIYWSPRIAGVLIILFISMFALDVFSEGHSLGEMLLGFLMHMLPSIVMAIVLALAWRWEWVGFVAFLVAGLFFLRSMIFNPLQGLGTFLLFSGPMFVIALLFGVNWLWRKELHPASKRSMPAALDRCLEITPHC
jgi:hypothetical protein